MRTCIKSVRDQALVTLAAPAAEAKDDTNRFFKPRNLDLYYGHLYIECYYLCQQCENYFEVAGSLSYKCVPFGKGFLKDHTLN